MGGFVAILRQDFVSEDPPGCLSKSNADAEITKQRASSQVDMTACCPFSSLSHYVAFSTS